MKVSLISHASVVIEAGNVQIWTDPWLNGKAFNNSWSLFPTASWDPARLDAIDYLWISHEHPDHFHIPTLKGLPKAFKERVRVLFQENNSDKMFEAFRQLGFPKHQRLPHRERVPLDDSTSVYCYQEGQMNSALAITHGGRTVLNINDAELRTPDCRIIARDIGQCHVVLNQFSIAGYNGEARRDELLPRMAARILENVVQNHLDVGADVTVPFASFVYFSAEDNKYINAYANKPRDVVRALEARGAKCAVMFPGDVLDTDKSHDSASALEQFDKVYAALDAQPFDKTKLIPLEKIAEAFETMSRHIHEKYPPLVVAMLRPVVVRIEDLDEVVEFSIAKSRHAKLPKDAVVDLALNSQPLHFAFAFPFGVQTLGVSARYTLLRNHRNWQAHRILFAMNNAELYLRPRFLFTARNAAYFKKRLRGGVGQIARRLGSMFE